MFKKAHVFLTAGRGAWSHLCLLRLGAEGLQDAGGEKAASARRLLHPQAESYLEGLVSTALYEAHSHT